MAFPDFWQTQTLGDVSSVRATSGHVATFLPHTLDALPAVRLAQGSPLLELGDAILILKNLLPNVATNEIIDRGSLQGLW
jgi:hypothetical protein